ncbi:hypothetical protein BT96DRAFT_817555, partial [Gymnopus androsaceus JB14]
RRGRSSSRRPEMVKFATFVVNVLTRARATTPVVLASLVYINRAKPHLHSCVLGGEALEHALNRAFLGALIIASKYLNDCTLHNKHWAMCTGVFATGLVGLIEREFLNYLDWRLEISAEDILTHHAGISTVLGITGHVSSVRLS